jgi:hypothetical protein
MPGNSYDKAESTRDRIGRKSNLNPPAEAKWCHSRPRKLLNPENNISHTTCQALSFKLYAPGIAASLSMGVVRVAITQTDSPVKWAYIKLEKSISPTAWKLRSWNFHSRMGHFIITLKRCPYCLSDSVLSSAIIAWVMPLNDGLSLFYR